MRIAALALLFGTLATTPRVWDAAPSLAASRLADMGDVVPRLFLRLVNDAIRGSIQPRSIRYDAPSTVVLEDVVLKDPEGASVARIRRGAASLSLRALLSGDLVISSVILDEPRLELESRGGKLNLLEALAPRKPSDPQRPSETAFRIDDIRLNQGTFRYANSETVTVIADGISAVARLELDLGRDVLRVEVDKVSALSGTVQLPSMDVPVTDLRARKVTISTDAVDLEGVTAAVIDAQVDLNGRVSFGDTGGLNLHARVNARDNTWPERLERLPFDTPSARGDVRISGPYGDLVVAVDAALGPGSAYGYTFGGGRAVVAVSGDAVQMLEGTRLDIDGGTLAATGSLMLSSRALDLSVVGVGIPLAAALAPTTASTPPQGMVNARVTITGIADGEAALHIDGTYTGKRLEAFGVRARGDVAGHARLTVWPTRIAIDQVTLTGERLQARVRGEISMPDKDITLDVAASADDATTLVPAIPSDVRADGVAFDGVVGGNTGAVVVDGTLRAARGSAYGVPIAHLNADLHVTSENVTLSSATAQVADGNCRLDDAFQVMLGPKPELLGSIVVDELELGRIQAAHPERADLPLAGRASLRAVVSGLTSKPTVTFSVFAHDTEVAGEALADVEARGSVTRDVLNLNELTIKGPLLSASAQNMKLALDTFQADGRLQLHTLDLSMIKASEDAEVTGMVSGLVTLTGDVRTPHVMGHLKARDVVARSQRLGSGPLEIGLAPDTEGQAPSHGHPQVKSRGHVVQLSTQLATDNGQWDAVLALAIQRRMVNAHVTLTDMDITSIATQLGPSVAPLYGFVSGTVEVVGALARPTIKARLFIPELAVHARLRQSASDTGPADRVRDRSSARSFERTAEDTASDAVFTRDASLPLLHQKGSVVVDSTLHDGQLTGLLCAFPAPLSKAPTAMQTPRAMDSPCKGGEQIWAKFDGMLDIDNNTFDITMNAQVDEPDLDVLLTSLSARDLAVGLHGSIEAHASKERDGALRMQAEAVVSQASVEPSGALRATLVTPTRVTSDGKRLRLETPARFTASGGEVDVTVRGEIGTDDIELSMDGTAALALVKLLTPQVANATGTVNTHLAVRGNYDDGIIVEGDVTPTAGAVITPRALGQPITFESGRIAMSPIVEDGKKLLRLQTDGLNARLGDAGRLQLRGRVDARTHRTAQEGWVRDWDMAMTGSGLPFRTTSMRGEAALDVKLSGNERAPELRGTVELTEGLFRKNLELRNFVLAPPPEKPSEPLWMTLAPLGLADLALDLGVTMQNFRVRAKVADFDADLLLRGNLRLNNTLRLPAVAGAVEVEEGSIDFPRARFDVVEMQVEFPTSADGKLNPIVHLSAHAEIPPGGAGTNDTEIPVDLSLDGGLNSGITLDLSALDPQREWDRSDLLGVILFGRSIESTLTAGDTSLAVRALLREATGALTAEIERFAQETFGVKVELDPTGWRWQLGRRLQIEGAMQLFNTLDATAAASASSNTTNTAFEGMRLRLLIVDHLRIGKNLSFEGRQGTSGGDLRLSLRLFED